MLELTIVHDGWRYLHIAAGFVGLAGFWIPVAVKKGSRLHVSAGKVFAVCAYIVGVSAFVSSVWGVIDPAGFLQIQGVPEAAAQQNAVNVRFLFFILWYLSSAILVGVQMGVRVLRTKNDPAKLETLPLRWNLNLNGVIALSLSLFGLYNSATADSGSRYIICVVIGFLGFADYRESLRFLKNPRPTPRAWWYKHMER